MCSINHFVSKFFSFIVLIVTVTNFACGAIYHITPSQTLCPWQAWEPCLNLSELATTDLSDKNGTNVTLLFLPGSHSLDRELVLTNPKYMNITTSVRDAVYIECTSTVGRVVISNVTEVLIKGLHFFGCGGNSVYVVDKLTITDSIFEGIAGSSTALKLHGTAATIHGCSFVNNTGGTTIIVWSWDFSRFILTKGGGAMIASNSTIWINDTEFVGNVAELGGAVFIESKTLTFFAIINSRFINNTATSGGVIYSDAGISFHIANCSFMENTATLKGGVMNLYNHNGFSLTNTAFISNTATRGGVIYSNADTSLHIANCFFMENTATLKGGVIYTCMHHGNYFAISDSIFINNTAARGGAIYSSANGSICIVDSTFTGNTVTNGSGGVIDDHYYGGIFYIVNSSFTHNEAKGMGSDGGVIHSSGEDGWFQINDCTFSHNSAGTGGVMYISRGFFNIANSTFIENSARENGVLYLTGRPYPSIYGVIFQYDQNSLCYIQSSTFRRNTALNGVISLLYISVKISGNTSFIDNTGSLYAYNSNLTLCGLTKFTNCTVRHFYHYNNINATNVRSNLHGGAITSILSNVQFTGTSELMKNKAISGGAILAVESTISISGPMTIAENQAKSDGGGVSLHHSKLVIVAIGVRFNWKCNISHNSARRGGGMHGITSTIIVTQPSVLQLISNSAEKGGGLYFEGYTEIVMMNLFKHESQQPKLGINFTGNQAQFGGAVFVDDISSSVAACETNNECFLQCWLFGGSSSKIVFIKNSATKKGSIIYGGMLNRCSQNPFSILQVYIDRPNRGLKPIKSIGYFASISDSISSLPVQVCFCNDQEHPDCSYHPPTINIRKGEAFSVSLVAVDQVNNSLDANVSSFLSSYAGHFDEGQQTQTVHNSCTDLTFNIFSPNNLETLVLYPEGPCGSSKFSVRHLNITFLNCTCPIGFEPNNAKSISCECVCDSRLSPYATLCNYSTNSLIRVGTNSWITYVNDTDITESGFVIHPNCPFDYCHDPEESISINFNVFEGADAQCAHSRTGVLCGACQQNLSLSLGSSRCLPCDRHWPVMTVMILLAFIIAGILLVAVLLALNMTVAVGLINGFIFYSNIIAAASSSAFFSSSKPCFPTVFVAWLNLNIGFDACFIDGLDAYSKTWLQLAFPVYIISLVVLIIICSTYSSKFAAFIGKRDPVATLATLILLSYAKLLSLTISAFSFANLEYPDDTRTRVWLPDGNFKFLQGKHSVLFVVALLIVLIGVLYTSLLFLWQWLVRLPKWKIFCWTRNTKFSAFITAYHAPYNDNYRYWTGLLLLVRVILYITGAATVSENPQVPLLVTIVLVGGLLLHKGVTRIYREPLADIVETVIYFNIIILTTVTLFEFKNSTRKQTIIMYMSTITTFVLFIGIIVRQVILLIRKKKVSEDINEIQSAALIHFSSSRYAESSLSNVVQIPYSIMPSE